MIDAEGGQAGVMSRYDALQMASAAELDLVEVSPPAEPPVVRVTAFGAEKKQLGWLALGESSPGKGIAARSSSGDRVWRVVADYLGGRRHPLSMLQHLA